MKRFFSYTMLALLLSIVFYCELAFCDCSQKKSTTLIYQPWQVDTQRSDFFWTKKVAEIKAAGFSTILLQWSAYGDVNYALAEKDEETEKEKPSFLSRFLTIAEQLNIKVIVGLWADPVWFARIKEDVKALDFALRKIRSMHLLQASTIWHEFGDNKTIVGWYIPEEIDDRAWRSKEKQNLLKNHLRELATQLGDIKPGMPLMISSFFTGFMTPDNYSAMLADFQNESGVLWLIQDGLGTGRLSNRETGLYMKSLAEKNTGKGSLQYKGILELFTLAAGGTGFVSASADEINKRESIWCEETLMWPEFAFSLRYSFPFAR